MSNLFKNLYSLNIDISQWDVSNVTNMNGMFVGCSNFFGKGLENWNVSNVINMSYMFCYCKNFNCDLSQWDVSNVTDMSGMFMGCSNFFGIPNWYKK